MKILISYNVAILFLQGKLQCADVGPERPIIKCDVHQTSSFDVVRTKTDFRGNIHGVILGYRTIQMYLGGRSHNVVPARECVQVQDITDIGCKIKDTMKLQSLKMK